MSPHVVARQQPGYPAALLDLAHPPERLFVLGSTDALPTDRRRTVAIVGTREATPYGVRVAADLAAAFARCGVTVVSGLARGIDAAAHRGAMRAAPGRTSAVLGTGIDVPYPAAHRALHREIASNGTVISEMEPGTTAKLGCFPRRNRIIAALAEVTVVVEAPFKSGAINTATQALELGRQVAAVPGPIDSPRSAGSNLLLRDGAHVITCVDDALGLLGIVEKLSPNQTVQGVDARVLEAIEQGHGSVDEVCRVLGWSARDVLAAVSRLELSGHLRAQDSGWALGAAFAHR